MSKNRLKIFSTPEELYEASAKVIIKIANKAISLRKRFTISLSGGRTPLKLYALLAEPSFRDRIDWKNTFVFWSDERCVPSTDERNNAHQAILLLIDKVDVPIGNVHRIPVNLPPVSAAINYEKELQIFFGDELPCFDLILLGLGENGHTASLFPGTKVIDEKSLGIREVYIEEEKLFRVTMTAPLINQARQIIFLVEGKNKATILEKVLTGSYQPQNYPAQLIKPAEGNVLWYTDSAAASLITPQEI